MAQLHASDKCDDHSSKWASSVQNITRKPCQELLDMATSLSPITSCSNIFDNGAGSVMFTQVIRERYLESQITAADISKRHDIITRKERLEEYKTFTHSMGTFFLPFVQDPARVIAEMQRVTKLGGIVASSTWSRVSWVPVWQEAVRETVDASWVAPSLFHIKTTQLDDVRALLEEAGLQEVQAKTFACPHPSKGSPEAAADEFLNMGNPSTILLTQNFNEGQLKSIRPAFLKAYEKKYNGVERP